MDPVNLAMAMSARFSSKDPKSQFFGSPNVKSSEFVQDYKLAIREYGLSPSMQKDYFTSPSA
jgi:hypothetical protein